MHIMCDSIYEILILCGRISMPAEGPIMLADPNLGGSTAWKDQRQGTDILLYKVDISFIICL